MLIKDIDADLVWQPGISGIVVSVDDITIMPDGLVPGGADLVPFAVVQAGRVTVTMVGGEDGERHHITLRVALNDGSFVERSETIAVLASAWAMPDGSSGWLGLTVFAERFGLDELIAASDAGASGVIDRAYVVARLADAQAEVEANIAGRYAMPLAGNPPVVPAVLQAAVADIARLRLYRRGVPDEVAEAAKTARRNLERIARGDLRLNLPSGQALPEAAAETEMRSFSGGARLYPDNLAEY